VSARPTLVEYAGQEIYLFDPVLCQTCLLELCERYSVPCANCGGVIPPYTQVGVLKDDGGKKQFVHMTTNCSTTGSAFHGYFGKGKLRDYIQVEAC
tara:strand:- start:303 stop:590 length:288 start_codon:yes stop_codon:yes gene_type:complete